MRLLYLDWPHLHFRLAAEEMRRTAPTEQLPELVVVGGQPWDSGFVVDCSPAAAKLGVRRGQALGTAHKLVPEARLVAGDPAAAGDRFEAALETLASFTPSLEADADPAVDAFGRAL